MDGKRKQPHKDLKGNRSGQGEQQEQRLLGEGTFSAFKDQREAGGTSKPAGPSCPPLPPALNAKG